MRQPALLPQVLREIQEIWGNMGFQGFSVQEFFQKEQLYMFPKKVDLLALECTAGELGEWRTGRLTEHCCI